MMAFKVPHYFLCFFCLAICVGSYISTSLRDPDLWWHLVIGKWILAHRTVPLVDYWTQAGSGQAWRAYSWFPEIIFSSIELSGGVLGLLYSQLFLGALLVGIIALTLGKIAKDYFFGGCIAVVCACGVESSLALRPQVLGWICFLLLFQSIDLLKKGKIRTGCVGCIVTMVAWANIHLSFVYGIVILAVWLLPSTRDHARIPAIQSILILLASICATFLTPYHGGEWVTAYETSSHPQLFPQIIEFHRATIHHFATAFVILLFGLLLLFLHYAPKTLELSRLGVGALLLFQGLATVKFLPFAILYAGILLAYVWQRAHIGRRALGNIGEAFEKLRDLLLRVPAPALSALFIFLAVLNIYKLQKQPIFKEFVPEDAVDFMITKRLQGPFLNPFGYGGYLMYRYADSGGKTSEKVSIDGRTNLITPALWGKYRAAQSGRENWKEFLTLANPETILWSKDSPMVTLLLESREWCQAFYAKGRGNNAAVLVKKQLVSERPHDFKEALCLTDITSR